MLISGQKWSLSSQTGDTSEPPKHRFAGREAQMRCFGLFEASLIAIGCLLDGSVIPRSHPENFTTGDAVKFGLKPAPAHPPQKVGRSMLGNLAPKNIQIKSNQSMVTPLAPTNGRRQRNPNHKPETQAELPSLGSSQPPRIRRKRLAGQC